MVMVFINFSVYCFLNPRTSWCHSNWESDVQETHWPATLTHLVTLSCFPEKSVGFSNLSISTLYMYLWYHGIMCNRNSRRFILFAGAIIPIYEIIDRVWTILFHAHAFNIGDFLTGTGRDNLAIHKNTYSVWTERRFGCFKSNITYM